MTDTTEREGERRKSVTISSDYDYHILVIKAERRRETRNDSNEAS